jgi:hypothetical protein
MKRNLFGILSLVVLSVLTATGAYAQSTVRADVPFAFKVGKTPLPAGTYDLKAGTQHLIVIRNNKTGYTMFVEAGPGDPGDASPRLVFHCLGDQRFLSEIWGVSGAEQRTLSPSKLEKELQMANSPSATGTEVVMAHN